MIQPIYNLPPIVFVGGETQKFQFNLIYESGNPFSAQHCKASFALIQYGNRTGKPLVTKKIDITSGTSGVANVGKVELTPADTVGLYGRYVYQISISAPDGTIEIPGQGLIDIIQNIHSEFIQ